MRRTIVIIICIIIAFPVFSQTRIGFFTGAHSSLLYHKIVSPSLSFGTRNNSSAIGFTTGIRLSHQFSPYFILANETAILNSAFYLYADKKRYDHYYVNSYLIADVFPMPDSNKKALKNLSLCVGLGISHLLHRAFEPEISFSDTGLTIKVGFRYQNKHWYINPYLDIPLVPYEGLKYGDFEHHVFFRNLGISLGTHF